HSGSPLKVEFATRTLSEFGSRAAAFCFKFQLTAGQFPGKRSHWKTVCPLCCSCHLAVSHSFLIRDGGWERLSFELRHIGIRQRPFGGKLLGLSQILRKFQRRTQ